MHETNDKPDRTGAASAVEGETATAASEPEWRPNDALPLGGASTAGDGSSAGAWSSPEAPPSMDVTARLGATDPRSYVGPEQTPSRGLRNTPIPSLAAVNGHPIHPMLVPLPIGAFVGALASDVAYAATGDRFWARASRLLLGAGVATGALAGAVGAVDFTGRDQIRDYREAWAHAGGNAAAIALGAVNLAMRPDDSGRGTVPMGLALSALTGAILLVTGWFGGELSYRHRVGVMPD